MDEETLPDMNTVVAPHRLNEFNEVHSSIKNLHEDISSALDLSEIQTNFDHHSNLLKQKEDKLRETVRKLELTKETLLEEVHVRESDEKKLNQMILDLRAQKTEIESRLSGYEQDVQSIQSEKEKLDSLLSRMKGVLTEMREKVAEFQKVVKAE